MALKIEETHRSGGGDYRNGFKFTRVFEVYDPDRQQKVTPYVSMAFTGLSFGDTYSIPGEALSNCYLVRMDTEQTDSNEYHRVVTAEYQQLAEDPNPVNRLPKIGVSNSTETEIVEIDVNGEPILNSANMPYTEPLTRNRHLGVYTLTKNQTNYPYQAFSLLEKVGRGLPGIGLPAMLVDVHTTEERDPVYGPYWVCEYKWQINPDGFKKSALDQGRWVIGDNDQLEKPFDAAGQPMEITLLDGSGKQLPEGGTPVFRDHEIYYTASFGGLV